MTKITVSVTHQAKVTVKVEGVAGPSCTDLPAVKSLEKALGKVTQQELTSDYYQPEQTMRQEVEN